jgi:hypothetical protein
LAFRVGNNPLLQSRETNFFYSRIKARTENSKFGSSSKEAIGSLPWAYAICIYRCARG